ncbi:MAG: type II secretion system protein N [Candidatus Thiodiazotropha sp.]
MMRWPAATALAIAGYLFFLLYNLPAQHVVGWFSGGNQLPLTLQGISGTVWSGEAEQVSYQRKPLGQMEWHFKPSRLILGKLAYGIVLKQAGQQLQGTFITGFGNSVRLEEVDALLLASQLPEWLQQRQIRVDGKVRAQQLDLAFTDGQLTAAEGSLQWLEGAVQSPLNLTVGDLQADLTTDEASGDITAAVRDLKGSVAIQADVSLKPDGNFQLKGKLKPGDKADPGLSGALQAIGRPQADGTILINYAGKM